MNPVSRRDTLKFIAGASAANACSKPGASKVEPKPAAPPDAAVLSVEQLWGASWPTSDPFLFCVHHDDRYPRGNEHFGPLGALDDRNLGSDFSGKDGFNMYHGRVVPGFPRHPHRGFETVTMVRNGLLDHSDSLGARARYGRGDVQWLTAGAGILHAEMFPLLESHRDNPVELFQIWLNLPKENKLVAPHFKMLWAETIPVESLTDSGGRGAQLTLIAGSLLGLTSPDAPPNSWAAAREREVLMATLRLAPDAEFVLPAARAQVNRSLYFFRGAKLRVADRDVPVASRIVATPEGALKLRNGPQESELLILQGLPIGQPVVKHGPFVMNTQEEIVQAFADYRQTGFGGWPWPEDDPVHGASKQRFAARPGRETERPG